MIVRNFNLTFNFLPLILTYEFFFIRNNKLETLVAYFTKFKSITMETKRKEVIDRIGNSVGNLGKV